MVITDCDSLAAWLVGKPDDCCRFLALRMAMRVFPLGIDRTRFANDRMHQELGRVMIRALVVSWVRLYSVAHIIGHDLTGAQIAYLAAQQADDAVVAETACAVSHAASAACAIWEDDAAECAVATAYNAEIGVIGAAGAVAAGSFWRAVNADCQRLDRGSTPSLLLAPLWFDGAADWFASALALTDAQPWQAAIGYNVWRDWYGGRIDGRSYGFAVEPALDADISRRLMAADDDWWDRDGGAINAEVRGWLS